MLRCACADDHRISSLHQCVAYIVNRKEVGLGGREYRNSHLCMYMVGTLLEYIASHSVRCVTCFLTFMFRSAPQNWDQHQHRDGRHATNVHGTNVHACRLHMCTSVCGRVKSKAAAGRGGIASKSLGSLFRVTLASRSGGVRVWNLGFAEFGGRFAFPRSLCDLEMQQLFTGYICISITMVVEIASGCT